MTDALIQNPTQQFALAGAGGIRRFLLGHFLELRRDPLGLYRSAWSQFGDLAWLRFGPPLVGYRYLLVTHPDHIRHILCDNHANYTKSVFYKSLKRVMGQGLVTSEGALWERQRRLIQPAFQRGRVERLAPVMLAAATRTVERWRAFADQQRPLDVAAEMSRLTLDIVATALFGVDLARRRDRISQALTLALERHHARLLGKPFWMMVLPVFLDRPLVRALRDLDDAVHEIISQRRRSKDHPEDVLSLLIDAADESPAADRQVRDEVMTLLTAGHETTANVLTWTWYLLAQRPDVEARLHTELDGVRLESGAIPTGLQELRFTRNLLREAMRLYPPIWLFERSAIADDHLGACHVPKGTVVAISPYVLHRHPRFWNEPERFDPDRFSSKAATARHRFAYIPFGGGPRACIGADFAMMELQVLLATLAREFQLRRVSDDPVELDPTVTLRPRGPVMMRVTHRR